MANDYMTLGNQAFSTFMPDDFTVPQAKRVTAVQETYGGVAFFSWGMQDAGQRIVLVWDMMDTALFDTLNTMLAADATVVWNPQIASGITYNCEILTLSGKLVAGAGIAYRRDVNVELLILSKVVAT